ncbi:MAG: iron chelate uptake ABC transporter family permease subunit [bacterium]
MIRFRKWILILGVLLVVLLLAGVVSLFIGVVNILPFGRWPDFYQTILFEIRLPRILLGCIVGAGLAVSGAVFQGLLRNPLADPYILGTSSGAALGASLGLLLKLDSFSYGLPLTAFLFSILALMLVYGIANSGGRMQLQVLLLAGVIVSTFLAALVMLVMSLAKREVQEIIFWIMGNLGQTDYVFIRVVGIMVLAGCAGVYVFARDLNIISLGEEKAVYLGIEAEKVKKILFVVTALIVGAVVSISGMIGFVGLIIPHLVRLIVGPDHRILLPASGLVGAIFLILSDTLARTIAAPIEIPVGVITALFGAPFFIFLLIRQRKKIKIV